MSQVVLFLLQSNLELSFYMTLSNRDGLRFLWLVVVLNWSIFPISLAFEQPYASVNE